MQRTALVWMVAGALVAVVLAGCADEPTGKPVKSIFGTKNVKTDKKTKLTMITGAPLEGNLGKNWTAKPFELIESETVTLPDEQMTILDGGGKEATLPVAEGLGRTLQVRFNPKYDLAGHLIRWGLAGADGKVDEWSAPSSATTYEFKANGAYRFRVKAQLVSGDKPIAETQDALVAGVILKWTYDSKVWPFGDYNANLPQEPPNWDSGADRYNVAVPADNATLKVETVGRDSAPTDGGDVDLQIEGPGTCVKFGAGGAAESLSAEATHGGWTVRVGTVDCAAGHQFQNAGPVPYTATITLSWGPEI